RVFRDMAVPEVLLSGNHQEIEAWRRAEARSRTRRRRPDLIAGDDPAEDRNETTR
ncbi:MAG: tRNA (guanosine(37)-N1)-methyltransferase TrmD, partial [Planctomycetes bacterium]|nr:tRNA (guanosine(37)-N1)-methyltransferase TrmD [Planctomycetota bacterium]